jgi:hypothetical protein
MPFLIYNKTAAGEHIHYERINPLKLAGPDGLIARHVRSLAAEQSAAWKFDAIGLIKLAGARGDTLGVLFDAARGDATAVCLYELTLIHGSCHDTSTNLALDFNIVLDRELSEIRPQSSAAFDTPLAATPKKLREILALTGGPGGGDWKWDASPMQLGATVVSPHESAPPCAKCSCGSTGAK